MDKKKIIIVEDEIKFAKMVKLRLESIGYQADIACDAYEGTQKIIKGDYDLIILDLMMPAGGGFALLERIRKFPEKSDIPVIVLTGRVIDDEIKSQAEILEVSSIFQKPYDTAVFVDTVNSLMA